MPAADPRDARDPVGGGVLEAARAAAGSAMPPTTPERCPVLRLRAGLPRVPAC